MTKQRVQYNGMLLLASYVQRLHVFYATRQHTEQKTFPQLAEAKIAFESLNAIIPLFEQTRELTPSQKDKLLDITAQTKKAMDSYFQVMNTSFSYKVAIVASTLFAEQLLNSGIIRLSKLFQEDISRDFEKRVSFYEQRTQMIQAVVVLLKDGKPLEAEVTQLVEELFTAITGNERVILDDLHKIVPMLDGQMKEEKDDVRK